MGIKRILTLLIFSIFIINACSASADPKFSSQYDECMNKSGGVTVDMLNCNASELKYQNYLLNKNYQEVMSKLSPKRRSELRNIELIWLRYRTADCDFYMGLTGGTIDELNASSCFLNKTASRAETLKNLLPPAD